MFIRVGLISGVLLVSSGKVGKEDAVAALQSAASIGLNLAVDGSRTAEMSGSQLEVTNKLQQTLGDTIMQSITNSDPDAMNRINGDFVKVLEAQMTAIADAVNAENVADKEDVGESHAGVAKCNSDMKNSFVTGDTGVDFLNSKVQTLRDKHADCRVQEVVVVDERDEECREAQTLADIAGNKRPTCTCEPNQDKKERLGCMKKVKTWVSDHYSGLDAADQRCDDKQAVMDGHAATCDGDQRNFEAQYCTYATKLEDVCTQQVTCYNEALAAYNAVKVTARAKEVSHKELVTAVARVNCLIGLFDEAKQRNLVEGNVTGCLEKDVDTSSLNVDYLAPEDKEDCDTATVVWNSTEYAALNQTHIEARTECLQQAPTDPPPTTDPPRKVEVISVQDFNTKSCDSTDEKWVQVLEALVGEPKEMKITMDGVVDYYRPIAGSSFKEMILSSSNHQWSPDGVNWHTPKRYGDDAVEAHRGGSERNWVRTIVPDDMRRYLTFWGFDDGQQNDECGCCAPGWHSPFLVDFVM